MSGRFAFQRIFPRIFSFRTLKCIGQFSIYGAGNVGLVNFGSSPMHAQCSEKNPPLTAFDCIKQACLLSVNAASTLLTSTVAALIDASKNYQDSLNGLIILLQQSDLYNGLDDELWDSILELRHQANEYHTEFHKLLVYVENVNKLVEATIEAAFNAEAEYVCKTLCERSHSAAEEIEKCKREIENLEQKYLEIQVRLASQKNKRDNNNNQKASQEQVIVNE